MIPNEEYRIWGLYSIGTEISILVLGASPRTRTKFVPMKYKPQILYSSLGLKRDWRDG